MTPDLPQAVAKYFDVSNGSNSAALVDCFAADAVVLDERVTHTGLQAIESWFMDTRNKYQYTVTPLSSSTRGERLDVLSLVQGAFPGSPIRITYSFALNGGKIQSLEIR